MLTGILEASPGIVFFISVLNIKMHLPVCDITNRTVAGQLWFSPPFNESAISAAILFRTVKISFSASNDTE